MDENAPDSVPLLDRCLLEARAAHVYLDVVESLSDPAQRARNVASARAVLARLDVHLAESMADEGTRARIEELRLRLIERLARITS